MSPVDSVLLVAFGGPERPEDIRPFLQIVTTGRPIPPARLEEVARHYEIIGGRSPLNALTRRQGDALAAALAARDRALPVWVGMRNWHPFLHETLAEMKDRGRRRAVGIILSSLQTEASWARYVDDVAAAREKVGPAAPGVVFAPPWADHPRFVDAMADRTRAALEAAGRAIAGRLGRASWTIAYQSRSGSPRDPWLEPDVADAIRALGREGAREVVVVPVGFVCDHVEVLYDLDVEARRAAEAVGVAFHRAPAANDHPDFIAMLADLVDRVTER